MIKIPYQFPGTQWGNHALPVALILAITVLFFTPRFFSKTYSAVGQHMFATYPWAGVSAANEGVPTRGYPQTDHAETYYPLTVFATAAWRNGELPMWLPYSFGGIPIMELGMTSLLYPPRLLLLFFFDPPHQHDLMIFLHLLVAGLGMYALMRCWETDAPGAVVAAIVWQFNGHNTFWLVIEQMAMVAAWCPLMLLAATLAVRRRSFKWASLAGAAVGLALYSGGTHYVHLSGWLLVIWYGTDVLRAVIIALRQQQRRVAVGYLLLPLVSLATALVIGLAYWLPLLSVLNDISRLPLSFAKQASKSISWLQLLQGMSLPRSTWTVAGNPDSLSFAFTGLTAVALAIPALLLNRSRHVRIAFGFVIMALMTVLGVQWWLKLLYYNVPFFNTMNLHPAFYIFTFSIAVLAGFGLHELGRRWTIDLRISSILAMLVAVTGLAQTGLLLWAFHALFRLPFSGWLGYVFSWRALALAAVVAFIISSAFLLSHYLKIKNWSGLPIFSFAAPLLVVSNLFLFAWVTVPYHWSDREWFFPETPLLSQLKTLQQERRMLPVYHQAPYWTPPVLAGKTSAIFGLRSGNGYESLLPRRTAFLWRTVEQGGKIASQSDMSLAYRPYYRHDRLPISLLEKLSVGLLVTPPRVEPMDAQNNRNLVTDGTLRLVYQGQDGWIYENTRAPGRAILVPQTIQVANEQEALKMLASAQFDARRAALIEQPLSPQETAMLKVQVETNTAQPSDTARIIRESLNEIEIETVSSQANMLVLNDMWAAGWRATVDGTPQAVRQVNFAARGVVVPSGQHHIVFRYRPPLLLASLGISVTALLLLIVWLCAGLVSQVLRYKRQAINLEQLT